MKNIYFLLLISLPVLSFAQENVAISKQLNAWHQAAANANFDSYFSKMTNDSFYMGTDPDEHWSYEAFKAYAKPYFDKGKAWSFTPIQRHITVADGAKLAWFDELLETQMGVCRGSGIMRKENGAWKVVQYVLSIGIPNEKIADVLQLKNEDDKQVILKYSNN